MAIAIASSLIAGGVPLRSISQTLPIDVNLTAYTSTVGQRLLIESEAKEDFWQLSAHFLTQITQSYCGVASSVMVLNSLGLPAPQDPRFNPYARFTQRNFFTNPATRAVLPAKVVRYQGMTLAQLGELLRSHGAQVRVMPASNTTLDEFRTLVKTSLAQPDNYVLVNYLRKAMGQKTGGHISPLAAYHADSDRFLILDVARYKYPPVWVKAEDLWRSLNTIDATSGKTRGFVLVSKPDI